MKRRYDDEDERPNWMWRLVKGIIAGAIVSAAAVAAISIYVLPPPAPPPVETVEVDTGPKIVDGIEVASKPAYFGISEEGASRPAAEATGEADDDAAVPVGPIELSGPALVVNAVPFDAPPDKPLVAVVIDDAGADPMLHESLFALDLPLTIGVVSGGAGDTVTARNARDAGFEVVAELPFAAPGEAEGAALEYNLPAEEAAARTELLMRRLPVAVAAAQPLAAPAPPSPKMLGAMMEVLGPLGFAWLEHGIAPGSPSSIGGSGLDAIFGVSRFSIPSGTRGAEAHGILERAAGAAAESGAAVVMAAAEEEILLAVQLWASGDKARLAPLSAVIRRQNGGDAMLEPAAEPASEPTAAAETAGTGSAAN